MADWRVGQDIICVDTNWVNGHRCPCPVKGRIYTIAQIIADEDELGISFHLVQVNSVNSWYSFHFRPIKKSQTDILDFISLLTPKTKKKQLEDVD